VSVNPQIGEMGCCRPGKILDILLVLSQLSSATGLGTLVSGASKMPAGGSWYSGFG